MRTLSPAKLLLLTPFALYLSGCPIYIDDDYRDRCVGAGCYDSCYDDWDCASSEICIAGFCEAADRCDTTSDCSGLDVCDAGVCRVPSGSCMADGDCASNERCESGVCLDTSGCSVDSDCVGDQVCDFRGACVNPPTAGNCRVDSDCATAGDLCVAGSCRNQSDVCQFDYECGGGRACVNSTCTELCQTDAECGSGDTCQNRFCRPAQECTTSSDCASTETCVGGACLTPCPSGMDDECTAPDVCAQDGYCRPDWQPRPICETSNQCAAGHVCVNGACRTPCPGGTNDECRMFDSQLPVCAADNLCYSNNETNPECVTGADCAADEACIDGICR